MQTRVSTPVLWCGDDLTVNQYSAPVAEYKISLNLLGANGSSLASLLLTPTAAEVLYAALWAALADGANAAADTCDLSVVAHIGEGDNDHQPVSG